MMIANRLIVRFIAFVSLSSATTAFSPVFTTAPQIRQDICNRPTTTCLNEAASDDASGSFNLDAALFCGGLAFDAYVEPPEDSSRWERGSRGMDVAFVSNAYTRNLYKGIVEVTPLKATGLPDEDDTVEGVMTGGGCDACLMVAAIEGQWQEDVNLLEKEIYHEGVLSLTGSAHIGRSSTVWSNVDKRKAENHLKKYGKGKGYHIKSSWGKGGQAIWPDDEQPFYLYIQDPATARLVFTIIDDDIVGDGDPIGSTYKKLSDLVPATQLSQKQLIEKLKGEVMEKLQKGEITQEQINSGDMGALMQQMGVQEYNGELKLTSKPRMKDKNGQVMLGVAAGAAVAGPVGAALGGVLANMYEGEVRGRFGIKLRYLPFPQGVPVNRDVYEVLGGMPGITWGSLYERHLSNEGEDEEPEPTEEEEAEADEEESSTLTMTSAIDQRIAGADLEHCFFIKHAETGGCCAVYRSVEKKVILVSFRGTCEPKDLITDASVIQEPWVEGEDMKIEGTARIHSGFRKSLSSISRRLKELVLATVEPGEDISQYEMYVTGHSLGGALATLFTADIGEYGIDAGRALPTTDPSEAWWKSIPKLFKSEEEIQAASPPRPKTLKMYNFGSPRVGDVHFAKRFDSLLEDGRVNAAYRIVNGEDIVARLPRTVNAIVGKVSYDHVGTTVLVNSTDFMEGSPLWIEGQSDDSACPVRDATTTLNNPLSEGLIADIFKGSNGDEGESNEKTSIFGQMSNVASAVSNKLKEGVSVSDVTSIVGIDRDFTDRELKIISSFVQGNALAHHMEDQYYAAMGRASGFSAKVGEDIEVLENST